MRLPWLDETLAANGAAIRDNFSAWFDSSKVVDSRGRPLVVYHGTAHGEGFEAGGFSYDAKGINDYGDADIGFFFGSAGVANNFAEEGDGAAVLPVYLSLQRPLEVSGSKFVSMLDDFKFADWKRFKKKAIADGCDGIIVRTDELASRSIYHHQFLSDNYVAFHPEQIKSAVGNAGLYLPSSPSLTDLEAALALRARNTLPERGRPMRVATP